MGASTINVKKEIISSSVPRYIRFFIYRSLSIVFSHSRRNYIHEDGLSNSRAIFHFTLGSIGGYVFCRELRRRQGGLTAINIRVFIRLGNMVCTIPGTRLLGKRVHFSVFRLFNRYNRAYTNVVRRMARKFSGRFGKDYCVPITAKRYLRPSHFRDIVRRVQVSLANGRFGFRLLLPISRLLFPSPYFVGLHFLVIGHVRNRFRIFGNVTWLVVATRLFSSVMVTRTNAIRY